MLVVLPFISIIFFLDVIAVFLCSQRPLFLALYTCVLGLGPLCHIFIYLFIYIYSIYTETCFLLVKSITFLLHLVNSNKIRCFKFEVILLNITTLYFVAPFL